MLFKHTHVLKSTVLHDVHSKVILHVNLHQFVIQLNVVDSTHEFQGGLRHHSLILLTVHFHIVGLFADWLSMCHVEHGVRWASGHDLVVEHTVAFVHTHGCHVSHGLNSFVIEHGQFLLVEKVKIIVSG